MSTRGRPKRYDVNEFNVDINIYDRERREYVSVQHAPMPLDDGSAITTGLPPALDAAPEDYPEDPVERNDYYDGNTNVADYHDDQRAARAREANERYDQSLGYKWSSIAEILVDYLAVYFTVGRDSCSKCKTITAKYRCVTGSDISCGRSLCEECAKQHKPLCHSILDTNGNRLAAAVKSTLKAQKPSSIRDPYELTLISLNGFQNVLVEKSTYGGYVGTLMENGFFPSAPIRPKYALCLDLLDVASRCLNIGNMSISSFIDCFFESKFDLFSSGISEFLSDTLGTTLRRYEEVVLILKGGRITCPLCPTSFNTLTGEQNRSFIFMDGNFSAKHYEQCKSTTISQSLWNSSPYKNTYFPDIQEEESAVDRGSAEQKCSSFTAGREIRLRDKLCDSNGIFGGLCSHGFPVAFQDIPVGEGLIYARKHLRYVERTCTATKKFVFYDIACKFGNSLASQYVPLVPELHSYAHILKCQWQYSPRFNIDCGLRDGEDCERFWSVVSKTHFVRTRYCSPEARLFDLSVKFNSVAEERFRNISSFLRKRFKRANDTRIEVEMFFDLNEGVIPSRRLIEDTISMNKAASINGNSRGTREEDEESDGDQDPLAELKALASVIKMTQEFIRVRIGTNVLQGIKANLLKLQKSFHDKLMEYNQVNVPLRPEDITVSLTVDIEVGLKIGILYWKAIEELKNLIQDCKLGSRWFARKLEEIGSSQQSLRSTAIDSVFKTARIEYIERQKYTISQQLTELQHLLFELQDVRIPY